MITAHSASPIRPKDDNELVDALLSGRWVQLTVWINGKPVRRFIRMLQCGYKSKITCIDDERRQAA